MAPCLAGRCAPADIASQLDISYATVTRWLCEFRDKGLPGLFPATQYPREPYTPEKIIVTLVAYKCFAPKASARELAQVIQRTSGYKLHHETAGELLKRYFFWKHPEFRERLTYPVPSDPQARRLEMVKLHAQGWSEKRIADLLHCSRTTVYKWLRRWQQEKSEGLDESARLFDYSHAPQQPRRKVYFGTIHLVLTLQKKYGYAGWFRIKGYLERDYGIRLSETTIKKIMRLNRRVHLAPQRPIEIIVREGRVN